MKALLTAAILLTLALVSPQPATAGPQEELEWVCITNCMDNGGSFRKCLLDCAGTGGCTTGEPVAITYASPYQQPLYALASPQCENLCGLYYMWGVQHCHTQAVAPPRSF